MSEESQPLATEEKVAPATEVATETPAESEAAAPKTYTEEEVKALKDAEAAKIRNKYERKLERAKIEAETRQQIEAETKKANTQIEKLDPAKFESWEAYQDAMLEQKVEAKLQKRENETKAQHQERVAKDEMERVETLSKTMLEKGNEKYGDMDEIIEGIKDNLIAHEVGFAEAGRMAILDSDLSADILHHLNKNPDEAIRIAKLSEYGQAKEIGKLEITLAKPIKTTQAPTPVSPIEGDKTMSKSLEKASPAEYQEMRRKQGARWA